MEIAKEKQKDRSNVSNGHTVSPYLINPQLSNIEMIIANSITDILKCIELI